MDIAQMSVSASVLIIALVLIRAFTLYKLPKKTFPILWSIVLCRLLIPFSITSRFSFQTGIELLKRMLTESKGANSPVGVSFITHIADFSDIGESVKTVTAAASVSPLELIWFVGMCACAVFFIVAYIKCRREFKTSLPVQNELAYCWLREHSLRRTVQIRQSDRIKAPMTYGVFRPVILLPKDTDWTDETRIRYILAHEFTHIRHFDTLAKLILTAALCVHWFNPLVWLMYVLANRDIELSCDETVVRTFGETTKSEYAQTLIELEEKKSRLTPLVSNFSKHTTEERINAIMKIKKTSLAGIILALVIVISVTTVFATNGSGTKTDLHDTATHTEVTPKIAAAPDLSDNARTKEADHAYAVTEPSDTTLEALPEKVSPKSVVAQPTPQATNPTKAVAQPTNPEKDATPSPKPSPVNQDKSGEMEKEPYVYPVNKNGETYGSSAYGNPDLTSALGTEGQSGYIRDSEIPGANVTNLKEAEEYMNWLVTQPSNIMIPLYDQEGNVIGEFSISNGEKNRKQYDSLEDAREAFANGD